MAKNELTDPNYWENIQGAPDINLDDDNLISTWLCENIDFSRMKDCIEIGCYPGRYLSIFANNDVVVNGIDYIESVNQLADLFRKNNFEVGEFHCADFRQFHTKKKYDCVCSFGFVEHFNDWKEIFIKHFELVNSGGKLIIEVPNFKGALQRLPRIIFDRKNYLRHNIDSMDLVLWKELLIENGYQIEFAGYIGGYSLWFEKPDTNFLTRKSKSILIRLLRIYKKIIYGDLANHPEYSAAVGIIARKP